MTLSELRERIARARRAAPDGAVVDPYVRALVELAALAEDRILAEDRHMAALHRGPGRDTTVARCRILAADTSLRIALDIPAMPGRARQEQPRRSWLSARIAAWRGRRA